MAEEENVWKQIGDSIVQYAPTLGGVLAPVTGGISAVVGAAVGLLGKAFGLGENPAPEALQQAIAADPQAALKLAMAERDFTIQMAKIEMDELKAKLDSVKSAQNRQIEHEKITGGSDVNLYALAWSVVCGFFLLLTFLLFFPVPDDQNGVVFMLFGSLSTGFGQVLGYFFGSSVESAKKTAIMGVMRK